MVSKVKGEKLYRHKSTGELYRVRYFTKDGYKKVLLRAFRDYIKPTPWIVGLVYFKGNFEVASNDEVKKPGGGGENS